MTVSKVIPAVAVALIAAPTASAAPKPAGTVARAKKAAAHEVYQAYFQLDPKLLQPGEAAPTFKAGCRRLTRTAFRCDWNGNAPDYYTASGTVRVRFLRYGVDAVLEPGSICVPEGYDYEQTGVSMCPDG